MKKISFFIASLLVISVSAQTEFPSETFTTAKGKTVKITMLCHGSIAINYDNYEIQIDPVEKNGDKIIDYKSLPKADIILVTHEHFDHLDSASIQILRKDNTRVIANKASSIKIENCEIIENGEEMTISESIKLKAVPAYNTTSDRLNFHPKGNGNGYLLSFDDFVVYVAGDSEDIIEMENLGKVDVAFLPVNQPYTMTVEQCINAAEKIKPQILIPYHLSNTDVNAIKNGIQNSNIEVKIYESLR